MDYKAYIEDILKVLVSQSGSDMHLSLGKHPVVRVSGQLMFLQTFKPLDAHDMLGIVKIILSEQALQNFLSTHEQDFAYEASFDERFRGNVFIQKGEIAINMRLVPKVKSFQELNLPPILMEFSKRKQGFFLVVGPVGQGKSTTLAAMIDFINRERTEHILTIEDPIEHIFEEKHSIIHQREVGLDTLSFESGLKSAFRQDVNVIMIGEMRTKDTVSAAVTAAETGHLVFSTLHTNSASQTIDRILDTFEGDEQSQVRSQLANSLLGIFSQRLIPRVTGGLIPAYEILINNPAVGTMIREKRTHEIDMVIETSFEQGMVSFNRSLVDLVRKGEISMQNAYMYSLNPASLERMLS
jgi:twitching motility protein PilT